MDWGRISGATQRMGTTVNCQYQDLRSARPRAAEARAPGQWQPEHEAHLERLKAWVCTRVDQKYRRGQAEHGGKLWEAPGLLRELHAETFDLLAYGQALDEHAARIFQEYDAGQLTAADALERVRAVLWGAPAPGRADGGAE